MELPYNTKRGPLFHKVNWQKAISTLDILQNEPSSKEKVSILKESYDPILKRMFEYALDHKRYHVVKLPTITREQSSTTPSETEFFGLLDKLHDGTLSGNAAIDAVTTYLKTLLPEYERVFIGILKKDLRVGVAASLANKAFGKNFINKFPCMLAKQFNKKNLSKIQYPAILQEKCDGVRCMLHVTNGMQVAYTRNGKVMQIPQFKGLLATENGYVIDGELLHYTDGVLDDRKTGNGKANSSLTTPSTSDGWVLVSWDFIPDVSFFSDDKCELTYTYRVSLLETATTNADNVILVTGCHDIVNNIDEANVKFQAYLDKGSEGAMLKNMDHLWVNKRSPDLVKMKAVLTADLKIIDVEEGTGKYQGMLGAILVTDETGNVSSYVGTGFSDTDRQQMWKHKESLIDMIVEVKYNEIITNKASTTKSLFLPVYIELRLDKNEVDSIK